MVELQNIIEEAKFHILKKDQHPIISKDFFPRVYVFEHNEKKIVFFAVTHTPESKEEQFEKIKTAFDELNPDIVFVEGMEIITRPDSTIRPGFEETLRDPEKYNEMIRRNGENTYAYKLAFDMNLPVISPEYSGAAVAQLFRAEGYTDEDIFLQEAVTTVTTYFYQSRVRILEDWFASHFKKVQDELGLADYDCSFVNFKHLAEKTFGDTVNFETGKGFQDTCNPIPPIEGSPRKWYKTNEMTKLLSEKRDEKILEEVGKHLTVHDKLFIVYGGSHGVVLEPALRYLIEQYA